MSAIAMSRSRTVPDIPFRTVWLSSNDGALMGAQGMTAPAGRRSARLRDAPKEVAHELTQARGTRPAAAQKLEIHAVAAVNGLR
jgi:hypothetical protein